MLILLCNDLTYPGDMWNKMNSANEEQYEPLDESPLGELDCPHREGSDAAATALDLAEVVSFV